MPAIEPRFIEYDPADFCVDCAGPADRPYTCADCAGLRALDAAEEDVWINAAPHPLNGFTPAEMDAMDAYYDALLLEAA